MSKTEFIIPERARDIGPFLVGRYIPFRKKRMVGPFCFIDHLGPIELKSGSYQDVGQHPHIGLSTLTYLFEGKVTHRDSLGTLQLVTPGDVAFMTSGKGIVHTERTPNCMRDDRIHPFHGFQIWIALPKDIEDIEPSFSFISKKNIPIWEENGAVFKLLAGEAFGKKSTLPVYSDLFLVEIKTTKKMEIMINNNSDEEIGVCVIDGYVQACSNKIEERNMLVCKMEESNSLTIGENTTILLLGGRPFPEERFIDWNFVSTSKEKIEQAKEKWKNQEFDMVYGEKDYIPLP